MSLYKTYQVDPVLETDGKWIVFGDGNVRFKIARDSIENPNYEKSFNKYTAKFKDEIQSGKISKEQDREIIAEVYAESIIMDCAYREDAESNWKKGIEFPDGVKKPTQTNIKQMLLDLPQLFLEIQTKAKFYGTFRAHQNKEIAGN